MEQPKLPNLTQPPSGPPPPPNTLTSSKKPPTPEELVAHYEAQGLDNKEASHKVIQELQGILYQKMLSGRKKKVKFMSDTVAKLDNVNTRLAIVEAKIDTKPGFPESFVVGVAAGCVVPLVLGGFGQVWGVIRNATNSSNPSPTS